jgi:hypothetical protein
MIEINNNKFERLYGKFHIFRRKYFTYYTIVCSIILTINQLNQNTNMVGYINLEYDTKPSKTIIFYILTQ